jgi:branched-chain amino acid transport system ATP-binding protein
VEVLHGIDLHVPEGGITCLIGANGAGKTTFLRTLSGLLRATAGDAAWNGVRLTGLPPHRIAALGIAHVPEGRKVFGALSVAENLALGAWRLHDGRAERRLREAVLARFPRLRERLSQKAGSLSGGEQQMLALGRALMAAPRLLMLDEPSMGLAPLIEDEVFAAIADLRADGVTVLLVEQNASAALDIADTAYVLETGTMRLSGPAAEIARDPAIAAAYLGA